MTSPEQPNTLARSLRRFFAEHMPLARGLSPHTVLSYRDAFTLLLRFLATRRGRQVIDLDLPDLEPDGVPAFLEDLETGRANCAATRNARLAAIHAFARFVAAQPRTSRSLPATAGRALQASRASRRRLP